MGIVSRPVLLIFSVDTPTIKSLARMEPISIAIAISIGALIDGVGLELSFLRPIKQRLLVVDLFNVAGIVVFTFAMGLRFVLFVCRLARVFLLRVV